MRHPQKAREASSSSPPPPAHSLSPEGILINEMEFRSPRENKEEEDSMPNEFISRTKQTPLLPSHRLRVGEASR